MGRRPEVALTVDHYADDWDELAWVQVLGFMQRADIAEDRTGMEVLAGKYPQYRDEPPGGPLLRPDAERVLCWRALER